MIPPPIDPRPGLLMPCWCPYRRTRRREWPVHPAVCRQPLAGPTDTDRTGPRPWPGLARPLCWEAGETPPDHPR
eukprot:7063313-Pyramimonas_sp.AAC.1